MAALRLFVLLLWTALPNAIQNQLINTRSALPVCVATSFKHNFSNLLVQACTQQRPRISEMEWVIGIKPGARLVV